MSHLQSSPDRRSARRGHVADASGGFARRQAATFVLRRLPAILVVIAMVIVAGCEGGSGDGHAFAERLGLEDIDRLETSVTAIPSRMVDDREAVEQWRRAVMAELEPKFGAAPALPEILQRRALPAPAELHRELIVFRGRHGAAIPAILQAPRVRRTGAGVLLIPGHSRATESGLHQLVYDHASYQHAAATRLAEAGFTTLAFELRGFGLLGAARGTEHVHVAFNALLRGSFYKALVIDDARRALQLLRAQEHVDPERIAAAGASLGGELAVALGALEPRVRAVASSSYSGSTGLFRPAKGERSKQRHYCHVIPGAAQFMRREDMILLLAPRPLLVMRGGDEYEPDPEFATVGHHTWRLLGNETGFAFEMIPGRGHEFFVQETIEFLRNVL